MGLDDFSKLREHTLCTFSLVELCDVGLCALSRIDLLDFFELSCRIATE